MNERTQATEIYPIVVPVVYRNFRMNPTQLPSKVYRAAREFYADTQNSYLLSKGPEAPAYDLKDKNIVLFVIDCLRSNHLSRTGYHRQTTPFLDTVGTYRGSISAAPWTYPSVSSILTGFYPHNHGACYSSIYRNQEEGNPPHRIVDDVFTLPELLSAAGYQTNFFSAIVTSELPIRGRLVNRSVLHNASAHHLTETALDWWNETSDPKFAYIHYGDLHEPLEIPSEQPFGKIDQLDGIDRWRFEKTTEPSEDFKQYRRERIRLYDTLIRHIDSEIERFLDTLKSRGELRDTIIVITSDHGEEFWEWTELERERFDDPRGTYGVGHGHSLVPEIVDVPLITMNLGISNQEKLVSSVDILPSIIHAVDAPGDFFERLDGVPLQSNHGDRVFLSEETAYGYAQYSVVDEQRQLIHSPHENQTVLINRDEKELIEDRDIISRLISHIPETSRVGDEGGIDSETEELLSNLGYR